jgi:hypothetical protein
MRLTSFKMVGLVALLGVTGCFSTALPPTSDTPSTGLLFAERKRLQSLATSHLGLNLDLGSLASTVAGYQYIFFVLPLARVYTPHLKDDLTEALLLEGALRGYNVQPISPTRAIAPLLHVKVTDFTVSGYDLLAVRRPSARVTLHGELTTLEPDESSLRCVVSADFVSTARFAFNPELTNALSVALRDAAKALFECLVRQSPLSTSAADRLHNR